MFTIGICDDSKTDAKKIRDILGKALFSQTDYNVALYYSGNEVMEAIEKDEFVCNLLLLDIGMEPVDGMKVAEYIRENNIDVDIIFVTKSVEHVYEGYVYKAFAYVLKDKLDLDMGKELLRYMEEISTTEDCLNIVSDGLKKRIPVSAIWYMESNGRKIIIHTKAEDIGFYAKLGDIEPILAEHGFVRTHQSYIVKIKKIEAMSRDYVTFDGIQIPISRRYYENVKKMYESSIRI